MKKNRLVSISLLILFSVLFSSIDFSLGKNGRLVKRQYNKEVCRRVVSQMVGMGFNYLNGDLFSDKSPILSPVLHIPGSSCLNPPDYLRCSAVDTGYQLTNTIQISNFESFQQENRGYVEVAGSVGSALARVSFSLSSSWSNFVGRASQQDMTSYKQRTVNSYFQCQTVAAKDLRDKIPLDSSFVASLTGKNSGLCPNITGREPVRFDDEAWISFFDSYGTHVVHAATAGGSSLLKVDVSRINEKRAASSGFSISASISARGLMWSASGSSGFSTNEEWSSATQKYQMTEERRLWGGDISKIDNIQGWTSTIEARPQAVKVLLRSITESIANVKKLHPRCPYKRALENYIDKKPRGVPTSLQRPPLPEFYQFQTNCNERMCLGVDPRTIGARPVLMWCSMPGTQWRMEKVRDSPEGPHFVIINVETNQMLRSFGEYTPLDMAPIGDLKNPPASSDFIEWDYAGNGYFRYCSALNHHLRIVIHDGCNGGNPLGRSVLLHKDLNEGNMNWRKVLIREGLGKKKY